MGVDPERPAGVEGPVTTAVTRRIKPGHEAAYEGFLAGISGAARAFPGYLGVEVFRPAPGGGGAYRIVYRFDSAAHLRAWLDSAEHTAWLARAEPHVAGPIQAQVLTGLEGWFTLPSQPGVPPPPPAKMALVTWATIFPLITLVVVATAPWSGLAAGGPAGGHHGGDGAADDLGGDAPGDQAAGSMAVPRPAGMTPARCLPRRSQCLANTRRM
jgi:antibiotic biosynthesis monooxygenase (ABM) superfamily enzyme